MPSGRPGQLLSLDWSESKLTHGGNDLSLQSELVLETTSEVANSALAIGCNVGNLADVVEHVAAGEEQDSDQADGGPEVAVLDDREEVRRGDGQEGEDTDNGCCDGDNLDIVDRANDGRVRTLREMAAEPCVNGFGLVGTDAIRVLVCRSIS